MSDPLDRFHRALSPILRALNLTLDPQQLALLDHHFELLLKWNRRLNLTSVRDAECIAKRHFGESLVVAAALPSDAATLVDIGSGAGFPGTPIAIARSRVQVSLVESVGKKAVFLEEVTRSLPNAHVLHDRFEALPICFHWAAMRGVAAEPLWDAVALRVRNLALIGGGGRAPSRLPKDLINWERQIRIPWEPGRVVLIGHVHLPSAK